MSTVFGFIGVGNMGGALARSVRRTLPGERLLLASRTMEKAEALAAELGAAAADDRTVAERADYIILGVKPQLLEGLLAQLRPALAGRVTPFVLVSMAAGVTIEKLRAMAGSACPVIRIIPNTPCAVGAGAVLYTCADVPAAAEAEFLAAMSGAGRLVPLSEPLLDAGNALSGCGPAFVDLFLEAMADGGVACGLPRDAARTLAAQTLAGAAALALETGKNPGELKDAVCSPGGSTIQGVRALERGGLRSTVMEAVIAAWTRTRELG